MEFTASEVKFLIGPHNVEQRKLAPIMDLRELGRGCPEKVFFRILEDRAQKLGSRFVEFRNRNKVFESDLSNSISAQRLF